VVENNRLEATLGFYNFLTDGLKYCANGCYVLISCPPTANVGLSFETPRKIDLAWLVVDQNARHWMIGLFKKEALKSKSDGHMISEPIGAASDFPEIVRAIGMDDAYR
jgi:hypothetical protein